MNGILFVLLIASACLAMPSGRWIKSDMHTHTGSSTGDTNTTAMTVAASWKTIGFNYLLVTDYYYSPYYGEYLNGHLDSANVLYGNKDFVVGLGTEYPIYEHYTVSYAWSSPPNYSLPTSDAFWASHGVSKYSFGGEQAFIHYVDSTGGWISINHPGDSGMSWSHFTTTLDSLLPLVENGLKGFEAFNGGNGLVWTQAKHIWRAGGIWDSILVRGHRFCALSGSDSHGSSAYKGFGCNRAYILTDSITHEAYFEALFAGRFYMEADFYNGAPFAIIMNVTAGDSMMGSVVTVHDDYTNVRVQASVDTAYARSISRNVPRLDTIRVICKGVVLAEVCPNRVEFDSLFQVPADSISYARVEVQAKNLTSGSIVRALSNPIYIRKDTTTALGSAAGLETKTGLAISPNPFNPAVNIFIGTHNHASLRIYNTNGRMVADVTQRISNGRVTWDASGMPSGVYIICATVGNKILSKVATLIR